jgi:hypothetical protein
VGFSRRCVLLPRVRSSSLLSGSALGFSASARLLGRACPAPVPALPGVSAVVSCLRLCVLLASWVSAARRRLCCRFLSVCCRFAVPPCFLCGLVLYLLCGFRFSGAVVLLFGGPVSRLPFRSFRSFRPVVRVVSWGASSLGVSSRPAAAVSVPLWVRLGASVPFWGRRPVVPVGPVAPSPVRVLWSAFRAGGLAGVVLRPSSRSFSGAVLVCAFRSLSAARVFAVRWGPRSGAGVCVVRRSPWRGGVWVVSVPVAVVPGFVPALVPVSGGVAAAAAAAGVLGACAC